MLNLPPVLAASLLTTLPEALHFRGEPTPWTRITRPGMRLHSFLEGLVIDAAGDMYLADVPHGRIFRIDRDTLQWEIALSYEGEPHGMALLPDGSTIVADYRQGLLRLDGAPTLLCNTYNGENFRGLSDLAVDGEGNVWFTDSGRTSLSDPSGRLYRRAPDGSVRCVLDNIPYPNGVAVSADGASVFVAATRANAVWKIARALPNSGKPMAGLYVQLCGGLGPDGLAVSHDGLLAIAHAQAGCVWVMDALGMPLARVTTPGGLWTTSVRFAADSRELYIVDAQTGSIFHRNLSSLRTAA